MTSTPPDCPDFATVLVANRGEIARRIFRTLRAMGLGSVAVFSDADGEALHVADADVAVRLGPAPSAESYLDFDAVIAAARTTGAGAIHPGYGFLSENADFAERCRAEGLVFIGPTPEAIRRMGDKSEAKAIARRVGVPVLEGLPIADLDRKTIHRHAEELGFPLLIKAAAGGGGKGMRTVTDPDQLDDSLEAAAREAQAAFGDPSLMLERRVVRARHIEVQILAGHHGRTLHLFERDCSLQRRHQKVFEEAPSPAVDPELRQRLGDAAVALAQAVDYRGAGTVEFLLDLDAPNPARGFYFLEMNTRLQVEHPVTEAITGLDLVRLQIEVAQGRALDLAPPTITGHAIEARLYAEDPATGFLPATGTVALWAPPEHPGLRIDSGVEQGSEVGIHYDPMLAKVIAHGKDRDEALRRLRRGLSELAVGGLTTNREFLLAVLGGDGFRRGEVDTGTLERDLPTLLVGAGIDRQALTWHVVAVTLDRIEERRRRPGPLPAGVPIGWRAHRDPWQEELWEHGTERLAVRYRAQGDGFRMSLDLASDQNPTEHVARFVGGGNSGGRRIVELDGVRRRFHLARHPKGYSIHGLGQTSELHPLPRFPERRAAQVAGGCAAPMTGKVVAVRVAEGDSVRQGDTLLVLEAMKMEHRLQAEADGIVASLRVEVGQTVDPDDVLVVIQPTRGTNDSDPETSQ